MKKLLAFLFILLNICNLQAQTLMIFGGEDHDVYLGNLNTSKFDSNSIWNEFGNYGNRFSSDCIWNQFGTYGNEFSQYSPFNKFASDPPVLVDKDGHFYGYLTANEYHNKRANFNLANIVCKYFEYIREDVSDWYEKIFE